MGISRQTDDDGLRWYSDGEVEVLSVTTVLKFLDEDTSGLDYWRDENDGSGDAPYWQHLFWYSAPRGTLCHYQALKKFEDNFDGGEELWGEEEAESMQQIVEGPSEDAFDRMESGDAPLDKNEVTYSVLKDEGIVESREQYEHLFEDSTNLDDVLWDDVDFFVDKFEHICDELGVDNDSVIRVEKFLVNGDEGYGGQCDLVYEDPNGETVVADLKTSSGLRQKHRLQSVAYMKAVEQADWGPDEVDRVEVWRIAPSKREYEVHANYEPDHAEDLDFYTDDNWFTDPWGEFDYDSIEDMWETFKDLSEEAHDASD